MNTDNEDTPRFIIFNDLHPPLEIYGLYEHKKLKGTPYAPKKGSYCFNVDAKYFAKWDVFNVKDNIWVTIINPPNQCKLVVTLLGYPI